MADKITFNDDPGNVTLAQFGSGLPELIDSSPLFFYSAIAIGAVSCLLMAPRAIRLGNKIFGEAKFSWAGGEERLKTIVQEALRKFERREKVAFEPIDVETFTDVRKQLLASSCGAEPAVRDSLIRYNLRLWECALKTGIAAEEAIHAGFPLTENLLERYISRLVEPGHSGASWSIVKRILFLTWKQQPLMAKAYGWKIPDPGEVVEILGELVRKV